MALALFRRVVFNLTTRSEGAGFSRLVYHAAFPTTFLGQASSALIMSVTLCQSKRPISMTVAGPLRSGEDSRIGLRILCLGIGRI